MHDAIKYAIDKGVPVVVATKVYNGRTLPVYGFKGGGNTLQKAGAFSRDLSGDKARLLTMLALPTTKEQKRLQEYFDK
jgi:L-asparaginase